MLPLKSNSALMLLALAALWATGSMKADAAAAKDQEPSAGNLGDSLLEGLRLDDLGLTPESAAPDAKPRPDWMPSNEALRDRMRRETGSPAGEDIGQRGEHPLTAVLDGMRRAEELLGSARRDQTATPVQREVVAELERLIAEMEKQCQGGGQCDKPQQSQNQQQQSQRSQAKAGAKPASQPSKGNSAARTSTARMGSAPASKDAIQAPAELMKAAWGHLPERVRERMLQSSSEEFLPEYREQLEEYYRRLAEREQEQE